jgi:t-SNARE complex subunit (syntaxin)
VTAKEMDKMMERTNKQANEIRVKLKVMEATNKKQVHEKGDDGDVKIKVTQHGVLTKNFLDVMMEYKGIQQRYQEKYKQRIERQFLVVKPDASRDEITRMVEGGATAPVFAAQIKMSGQKSEAKRALQDIQDRHQDVIRIERSIIVMCFGCAPFHLCLFSLIWNDKYSHQNTGNATTLHGYERDD